MDCGGLSSPLPTLISSLRANEGQFSAGSELLLYSGLRARDQEFQGNKE